MKYIKKFESIYNIKKDKFEVGDMVYIINTYSDPLISKSFDTDTQYEIVYLENEEATIFTKNNNTMDIPISKLRKNKIDIDLIDDIFYDLFGKYLSNSDYKIVDSPSHITIEFKNNKMSYDTFKMLHYKFNKWISNYNITSTHHTENQWKNPHSAFRYAGDVVKRIYIKK